MVEWPIRAAVGSGCFQRIVVSTDDDAIAKIARHAGAETPFERPAELSGDNVGAAPVIRHAIDFLNLEPSATVVNIYPTAPLTSQILREAVALHRKNSNRFVIGVGRYRTPIERALSYEAGSMFHRDSSASLTRSQDLPQSYFDAGKFHIATVQGWRENETMMSQPFAPFFLPDWLTVDIDEPEDWETAEALHRIFGQGKKE